MNRVFEFLFSRIKKITVYGLVGRSGTGKSYHSKQVAAKYNISLIIDDGLLIKGDRILAGHSAKQDPNFMAAVKTAVFDDQDHRDQIVSALLKEKYKKDDIFFIMGSDNFRKMPAWKNYEELIRNYNIIVIERERKKIRSENPKNIIEFIPEKLAEADSTKIRKMIKNNENVKEYLKPKVYEYIRKNKIKEKSNA